MTDSAMQQVFSTPDSASTSTSTSTTTNWFWTNYPPTPLDDVIFLFTLCIFLELVMAWDKIMNAFSDWYFSWYSGRKVRLPRQKFQLYIQMAGYIFMAFAFGHDNSFEEGTTWVVRMMRILGLAFVAFIGTWVVVSASFIGVHLGIRAVRNKWMAVPTEVDVERQASSDVGDLSLDEKIDVKVEEKAERKVEEMA